MPPFVQVVRSSKELEHGAGAERGRHARCASSRTLAQAPHATATLLFAVLAYGLGAQGKGLHEKVTSVQHLLPQVGGWLKPGKGRRCSLVFSGVAHAFQAFAGSFGLMDTLKRFRLAGSREEDTILVRGIAWLGSGLSAKGYYLQALQVFIC